MLDMVAHGSHVFYTHAQYKMSIYGHVGWYEKTAGGWQTANGVCLF